MRSIKLTVQIGKPVAEVFEFVINPASTPKWIDGIKKEVANEWPVKLGTIYRNRGSTDKWSEYEVTILKKNSVFMLSSLNTPYHVKYTLQPIRGGTELEYFEWVDDGELEKPFTKDILDKLKNLLEGNT
jgi:hypothetical protein